MSEGRAGREDKMRMTSKVSSYISHSVQYPVCLVWFLVPCTLEKPPPSGYSLKKTQQKTLSPFSGESRKGLRAPPQSPRPLCQRWLLTGSSSYSDSATGGKCHSETSIFRAARSRRKNNSQWRIFLSLFLSPSLSVPSLLISLCLVNK